MIRILLAAYIILGLVSCGDTCMKYANTELRPQSFHFGMKEKQMEQVKVKVITGRNKDGKNEAFRTIGFPDLFEAAEVGDTVTKKAGETFIRLIKKDTVLTFKYYCNGQVVY
ncbi:hypothetical protein AB6805_21445 [Chitinophaga sp. RCC_12]|uniref:hypothetical protein n=1 Tax=Chitinophaga sp. RCC_12 TaxID=3239226 RepID=UPI003526179F